MAEIFSAGEVVEIGIQIEYNGKDFYNALVKKSRNEEVKRVFKYLAGEEEEHIVAFRKILGSVQRYDPATSYPLEYFAYLNALAGRHVFTKKDKGGETAKKVKTDNEAVDLGIGFEKDSIIFYESIKKVVLDKERSVVDRLIDQELGHLMKLTLLKNALSKR